MIARSPKGWTKTLCAVLRFFCHLSIHFSTSKTALVFLFTVFSNLLSHNINRKRFINWDIFTHKSFCNCGKVQIVQLASSVLVHFYRYLMNLKMRVRLSKFVLPLFLCSFIITRYSCNIHNSCWHKHKYENPRILSHVKDSSCQ